MADNRLKSFVERIAKLHEDRKAIADDISEVVKEAAGVGYIPKTLRKVVARYMADPAKLAEDDALLETYEAALGRVGKALKAVREGATWDKASEATGVPRATLARAEAVSKRREMIPEEAGTGSATVVATGNLDALSPHQDCIPEEKSTTVEPENEAPAPRSVGAGKGPTDEGARRLRASLFKPHDYTTGFVATGADGYIVFMHCASEQWPHGRETVWEGAPVEWRWDIGHAEALSVCASLDLAHNEVQPSATPSVGAVAAEPRVASPFLGDDPGDPPPFLRGSRTGLGRGA